MIHGVDHIVILVNDLASAVADYTALGFTVMPGGEHTGGATHNALIGFADGSYLELIAFKQESPNHRWWPHVAVGEGLIDFALWPDNIATVLEAARRRGLALEGPMPAGRLRPDGKQVAWELGTPLHTDLPFLCADVTPRSLRVPDSLAWEHANRATGVAEVVVAVQNVAASAVRYAALLGVEAQPGPDGAAFPIGVATIVLKEGVAGSLPGERLIARGEGICELVLRTAAPDKAGVCDLLRTHGARVRFVL